MSLVAAPADRRFRRALVKPGRRRHEWRALLRPLVRVGAVGLLLAYGGYRGGSVVAHARLLQVDRVIVRGNERLSTGEVLAVLSGLRGESLVWTDLNAWRRRLLSSPWVRDAALRRSLPSTVDVVIWERQPVGIARINGEMYLVDERGMVIDQHGPQYADLDLPIIDGLSGSFRGDVAPADEERAALAGRVIAAVRAKPDVARRLSQVDVSDLHNVSVILEGDPAVIYLGEEQFLPRLQYYLELAPTLRERVPGIDYVDLRFDDRIYVRPAVKQSGTGGSATAARTRQERAASVKRTGAATASGEPTKRR
jgi:cell division protein FtsQ